MEVKVRTYICEDGEKFLGLGVVMLLDAVQAHCSLRKAALSLELSYTKALRMVNNLEGALGITVLDRRHGGKDREGSSLTKEGKEILELYRGFQSRCEGLVKNEFSAFETSVMQIIEEKEEK